ncbi:response regulator transcription factor [Candidatus Margulisiibacteriota bacterium]
MLDYSNKENAPDKKQYTVLVVDDNPDIVKLISAYLRGGIYEIQAAYDGKEALDVVAKHKPDLMLLDIMMPNLDGFGVAQKLKDDNIDLPIIVLTAKDLDDNEIQLLQKLGVKQTITKDVVNRNLLLESIQKHI